MSGYITIEKHWEHQFDEDEGYLVTFTAKQHPDRTNALTSIRQRSYRYPYDADVAADYLRAAAEAGRDAYFGVHLYERPGTRRSPDAKKDVRALWLDEDDGRYPFYVPEPTATINSSASRRHLYWALSEPISSEQAVLLNKRIASLAGGDMSKAGLTTILRAPETFNYKRLPRADPVTAYLTGAGPYLPAELDAALPPLPSERVRRKVEVVHTSPVGKKLDLEGFLAAAGIVILGEVIDGSAESVYRVECPWLHEHTGGDRSGTRVGQYPDGATFFKCEHAHCAGRGWAEFKDAVGPGAPRKTTKVIIKRVWR